MDVGITMYLYFALAGRCKQYVCNGSMAITRMEHFVNDKLTRFTVDCSPHPFTTIFSINFFIDLINSLDLFRRCLRVFVQHDLCFHFFRLSSFFGVRRTLSMDGWRNIKQTERKIIRRKRDGCEENEMEWVQSNGGNTNLWWFYATTNKIDFQHCFVSFAR